MVLFPQMENKKPRLIKVELNNRLAPWAAVAHLFRDIVLRPGETGWKAEWLDVASELWPDILGHMRGQPKFRTMAEVIWRQMENDLETAFQAEWLDKTGRWRTEKDRERVLLMAMILLKKREHAGCERLLNKGLKTVLLQKEVFEFSMDMFKAQSRIRPRVRAWVWVEL